MALDWMLVPTAFVEELMKEPFVMSGPGLSTHLLLQIVTPLGPLPINIMKSEEETLWAKYLRGTAFIIHPTSLFPYWWFRFSCHSFLQVIGITAILKMEAILQLNNWLAKMKNLVLSPKILNHADTRCKIVPHLQRPTCCFCWPDDCWLQPITGLKHMIMDKLKDFSCSLNW